MHTIRDPTITPTEDTDAAEAPTPTLTARHRVALPVPATVADLRAALRRMNGADRIADVWLSNEHGSVSLDGLIGFEFTVQVSA
jgi:hypothetical protein